MAHTPDNLAQAFAGESQANRKYLAFADKAEKDGFAAVARLFRAAAEAETVHARAHLRAMDGVKSTAENLAAAFGGETYEYQEMYPPMVAAATEEKNQLAKISFDFAQRAERKHADLYARALEAVKAGKDFAADEIYVCPTCGNVVLGKPTTPCEICNTAADKFFFVK